MFSWLIICMQLNLQVWYTLDWAKKAELVMVISKILCKGLNGRSCVQYNLWCVQSAHCHLLRAATVEESFFSTMKRHKQTLPYAQCIQWSQHAEFLSIFSTNVMESLLIFDKMSMPWGGGGGGVLFHKECHANISSQSIHTLHMHRCKNLKMDIA